MGMERLLVELPSELKEAMKRYAYDNKTTMAAIVCKGVALVLERTDIAPPPRRKPGPSSGGNKPLYAMNLQGIRILAPRPLQPEAVQRKMGASSSKTEEERIAYYIEQFGADWKNVQLLDE